MASAAEPPRRRRRQRTASARPAPRSAARGVSAVAITVRGRDSVGRPCRTRVSTTGTAMTGISMSSSIRAREGRTSAGPGVRAAASGPAGSLS